MVLSKEEMALMIKVREAVDYENNGCPMKDAINSSEVVDALKLLVRVVDAITTQ